MTVLWPRKVKTNVIAEWCVDSVNWFVSIMKDFFSFSRSLDTRMECRSSDLTSTRRPGMCSPEAFNECRNDWIILLVCIALAIYVVFAHIHSALKNLSCLVASISLSDVREESSEFLMYRCMTVVHITIGLEASRWRVSEKSLLFLTSSTAAESRITALSLSL